MYKLWWYPQQQWHGYHAIFEYIGAVLRNGFSHVDNVIPAIKTITWLLLSRLQGKNHTGTVRNLRNPASGTSPEPSGIVRDLPQQTFPDLPEPTSKTLPTPFYTGTPGNLVELASGTHTSTLRNPPEPSGTCRRNLHQHTPELSGTFRNLPPEPAPATRTGTHRSLSGLKTPLAYAVGE